MGEEERDNSSCRQAVFPFLVFLLLLPLRALPSTMHISFTVGQCLQPLPPPRGKDGRICWFLLARCYRTACSLRLTFGGGGRSSSTVKRVSDVYSDAKGVL